MSDLLDVQIRPYAVEDAPAVFEAARESIAEIQPWMPWCHDDYSVDESRQWLAAQVQAFHDGTAFEFAMVGKDGRYLGGCGLNQLDAINKRANLGYWVRSSAARRGGRSAPRVGVSAHRLDPTGAGHRRWQPCQSARR